MKTVKFALRSAVLAAMIVNLKPRLLWFVAMPNTNPNSGPLDQSEPPVSTLELSA